MGDSDLTPGQPRLAEIILPEEVWDKILKCLTDPEDVLRAGKTCTLFKRCLHSKMVEVNLAKVLPLLLKRKYIDDKAILKCRSVSKGWRDVMDNFCENFFLETSDARDEVRPTSPDTIFKCFMNPFTTKSGLERFMKEMTDHPRNPFIGRAVQLRLRASRGGSGDEEQDLLPNGQHDLRRLYNFFEIFGNHIWTLQLEMWDNSQFPIQVKEEIFRFIIRDVFELAPNLKKICIEDVTMSVSMSKNEIKALAPPPALEKLELSQSPDVDYDYDNDAAENAILLRHSNTQLKVLHIKEIEELRNMKWPNLKELHVKEVVNPEKLDTLALKLIMPKLELLSISLGEREIAFVEEWVEKEQKKAFIKFFRALHNLRTLSPNLKTLRFGTTWLWDQPVAKFARGLPCPENIKTLEIPEETVYDSMFHGTSDYSFLLRFPHIENIHISKDKYGNFRARYRDRLTIDSEIVEVHKFLYSGRMYESNIWKLLPSLKVFTYGEKVYTRSSYERRYPSEPKVPKQN